MYKWHFKNFIIFLIFSLNILICYIFFTDHIKDLSKDKLFSDLYQKQFVILKDSLLFKKGYQDKYGIVHPPHMTGFPDTIQEYDENPTKWSKEIYIDQDHSLQLKMIGVIRKGEHFKIEKIYFTNSYYGGKTLEILASVKNYKELFDVSLFLKNERDIIWFKAKPAFEQNLVKEAD